MLCQQRQRTFHGDSELRRNDLERFSNCLGVSSSNFGKVVLFKRVSIFHPPPYLQCCVGPSAAGGGWVSRVLGWEWTDVGNGTVQFVANEYETAQWWWMWSDQVTQLNIT